MEQITVAERLTELRKAAGLSQSKVADTLLVSRQAVSKWESGKGIPSIPVLGILAELYGTTPDKILTGREPSFSSSLAIPEGKFFFERLRSLRSERGVSQGELADALTVSRQSVSKWERGEAEPDADRLVAIAAFFDIPLALLIPAKAPVPTEETDEEKAECPEAPGENEKTKEAAEVENTAEVEHASKSAKVEENAETETAVESAKVEEIAEAETALETEQETEKTPDEPVCEINHNTNGRKPLLSRKRDPVSEKRFEKMKKHVLEIRRRKKEAAKQDAQKRAEQNATRKDHLKDNEMAYVYVGKKGDKVRTILPYLVALPASAAALFLITRKKNKK